ncbi:phage major capsid protein [Actinomycetospora sp. CA-053990]|uniref:phage major capsid protein n=1 Tax=Actinomycetospora sp. CA-053990 TaxID=3239891 RepID=UPI003D94FEF5
MAQISRSDAAALLATQDIKEIVKDAEKSSVALSSFRTVPMSSKQSRMPVLSALPTGSWVSEATDSSGVKPTSTMAWVNKDLIAEELAVIVPIHENVLDDSEFDIWSEVRPAIAQEFGRIVDAAVLFGTNKPSTWTDAAIVPGAVAASNSVTVGAVDLADDVNRTWAAVEADDFDVNIQFAKRSLRQQLRGLRDENGSPIYLQSFRGDGNTDMVYGETIKWVTNGSWADTTPDTDFIAGDASKVIIGIRQDVRYKFLDQATVGGINLAERDMVALRAVMRVAYAVAIPKTIERPNGAYPFAVLRQAS